MDWKQTAKQFYRKTVIVPLKRRHLRNHDFTIISNNCDGGIIYHELGERFNSPTINLLFHMEDYFLFLENFEEAIQTPITENKSLQEKRGRRETYPIGYIELKNGKSIQIDFMHYPDFESAKQKWEERCRRIHMDNLFVFMEAGIETTDEIVERFGRLEFKHKMMITDKPYEEKEYTCFLDIYEDFTWGKLIKIKPHTLKIKRYIDDFDYVSWLNS